MTTTRRQFLRWSAAGSAAALSSGVLASLTRAEDAAGGGTKPLRILVLGGTGLIGPALVQACIDRGHTVTLFNRGKTKTHLFPDLEKLKGDRYPERGEGLAALEGRDFDVVFDDCGYYPRHVRASAQMLARDSNFYVFVSSISVYASSATENGDEDAPLATMEDPTVENMGDQGENYGPLKVLCEKEAMAAFPGRCAVIRPGYIVGPHDDTDRFTYWPLRVRRGGEMLAPGTADDPIQIIDVRDLGDFMLKAAEDRAAGVYNACGPAKRMTMGEVLDTCKEVTKSDATFTWVPASFLRQQQDVYFPIWVPAEGETAGFHTWKNERAIAAGLEFRPLKSTVTDLLTWFDALPPARQERLRAGPPPETERRLLDAWKEQGAKG